MERPTTLPYNLEAEKSVLGSMLLSRQAAEDALELLKAEDFYVPAHQDIFTAMGRLSAAGEAIDTVTLSDLLARMGLLEQSGGVVYVTELSLFVPSAGSVSHYIKIVEERSIMRRLVNAGGDISREAMKGEKNIDVMLDDAERAIFDISMGKAKDSLQPIQQAVLKSYEKISELIKLGGKTSGVPTGFRDLDQMTGGIQKGDLVIIAGRPSMGKTAFALNIAENAALKGGKTVCIFSLEMPSEQLATRLLLAESGVNMESIRDGSVTDDELLRIVDSMAPLSRAAIYIDDTPGIGVAEIRSKCRRLCGREKLDMIIIDYLQLMQTGGKGDNRVSEIAEVTRSLKIMARELNAPVVLLSQLSRDPDKRTDHHPMMSDLRESGAIEQDADLILMLYRPAVYGETEDNVTEVMVAKHRNGPTGKVELSWIPQYAKFTDRSQRRE